MGGDYSHSGGNAGFVEKRGVDVHFMRLPKWLRHSS
jgi:hypothetical protein